MELLEDFYFNCTDLNFTPGYMPTICDPDQKFNYTGLENFQSSASGNGGFVLDFTRDTKINEATNKTLMEILQMPWN